MVRGCRARFCSNDSLALALHTTKHACWAMRATSNAKLTMIGCVYVCALVVCMGDCAGKSQSCGNVHASLRLKQLASKPSLRRAWSFSSRVVSHLLVVPLCICPLRILFDLHVTDWCIITTDRNCCSVVNVVRTMGDLTMPATMQPVLAAGS